jgi:uncharacterized protein (UPF0335 family)
MSLQARTETSLGEILERLHALETRMTQMESDRGQMITEAKAAAGMATSGVASAIAGNMLADIVTRITRLEMRQTDQTPRLPPADPRD